MNFNYRCIYHTKSIADLVQKLLFLGKNGLIKTAVAAKSLFGFRISEIISTNKDNPDLLLFEA